MFVLHEVSKPLKLRIFQFTVNSWMLLWGNMPSKRVEFAWIDNALWLGKVNLIFYISEQIINCRLFISRSIIFLTFFTELETSKCLCRKQLSDKLQVHVFHCPSELAEILTNFSLKLTSKQFVTKNVISFAQVIITIKR